MKAPRSQKDPSSPYFRVKCRTVTAELPHIVVVTRILASFQSKIFSMSTTPTPTYYAPSTTGDIVTTWLPLTTTYPSHGDCASNFWAFQDEIWAWVPDSPAHSWTAQCLPPVATLSYLVSQSFLSAAQDAYNIGPFIGCPNWFKAVTTLTVSETGSLTICCPT